MSGTETHGYDLVIEYTEQALQEILDAVFEGGLLSSILGPLGILTGDAFDLTVSLDQPTAGVMDVISLHLDLGLPGVLEGTLDIQAGIDVDRATDGTGVQRDRIRINLKDKLYSASAQVGPLPIPGVDTFLRDTIQEIPLLPVKVERASADATRLRTIDAGVVDDASTADRDCLAAFVTMGGGAPGDRAAFTRSFVSPGGNGGVAIGFPWMCRILSPKIDEALGLGGAFQDCQLTRSVEIEDGAELTGLSLSLEDGFIKISAAITKSGFCYSATGRVEAKLKMEIRGGRLVADTEVGDPDVDVDIPWYCYLAAAVVGALVGGVLGALIGAIFGSAAGGGVIGAIIGAIIVPVILHVATETVESVVEDAARSVAEGLNDLSPEVDVEAAGVKLLFTDAFIDDVTIGFQLEVMPPSPIRCEGTLTLPNGGYADLDNGRVGTHDLASADVAWLGDGFDRLLRPVCGARLARCGSSRFDTTTRVDVYRYRYDDAASVPLLELAAYNPFGGWWPFGGDRYAESLGVFAIRTNDERFAIVQAVEVDDGYLRLRYRTWEKRLPRVEITGRWACERVSLLHPALSDVRFVPSRMLAAAPERVALAAFGRPRSEPFPEAGPFAAKASIATRMPDLGTIAAAFAELPLEDRRVGRWEGIATTPARGSARFVAAVSGLGGGLRVGWRINGAALPGTKGTVRVGSADVAYEEDGRQLVLGTRSRTAFEFLLGVTVTDAEGTSASAERCVRYEPVCREIRRHLPTFAQYQAAFRQHFGLVELARVAKRGAL